MNNVLVTGAKGTVGAHLCPILADEDHRVLRTDAMGEPKDDFYPANITVEGDMSKVFRWARPYEVYHLAAVYGRWVSDLQPQNALNTNVGGTAIVANRAANWDVRRFVYVSSSEAIDPVETWYGHTKRWGEQAAVQFAGRERTLIVRPNMLYHHMEPYGFHRSVAVRFAYAIARGEEIEVHEGTARNFLFIPDACRMMKHLAEQDAVYPEPVVLCNTEEPIPVERIAEIMYDEIGTECPPLRIRRVEKPAEIKAYKRPLLAKGLEQFLTMPQEIGLRAMARHAYAMTRLFSHV